MSDLKVTAEHVRSLGDKQAAIATEIEAANAATAEAPGWIELSHGLLSFATSQAVIAATAARGVACEAMNATSSGLGERLGIAAAGYEATDAQQKAQLDGTMGR